MTVEEVQHQLQLLDDDDHFDEDCLDDPDEPIMDGSDEFSDLEGDECDAGDIDDDMDTPCQAAQMTLKAPPKEPPLPAPKELPPPTHQQLCQQPGQIM